MSSRSGIALHRQAPKAAARRARVLDRVLSIDLTPNWSEIALGIDLAVVHEKDGLVGHLRDILQDIAAVAAIEAAEWRVHNHRAAHNGESIECPEQRECDHLLGSGGPLDRWRAVLANDCQAIAIVDLETRVGRVGGQLAEYISRLALDLFAELLSELIDCGGEDLLQRGKRLQLFAQALDAPVLALQENGLGLRVLPAILGDPGLETPERVT